jgi:hypothetical protein
VRKGQMHTRGSLGLALRVLGLGVSLGGILRNVQIHTWVLLLVGSFVVLIGHIVDHARKNRPGDASPNGPEAME